MIPLKDNISHRKLPIVSVAIIIINCLIFFYEIMLGENFKNFIYMYGFIPQKLFLPVSFSQKTIPIFTSLFLHANLFHLIGNMIFMWVFADNVEDRLGHVRFFVFYILCGIFASVVHMLFNLNSKLPAIGASGAIAGVLGAYFLLFPYARVLTLFPFLFFWRIVELPAFIFLGFWFIYQLFFGLLQAGSYISPIAFWAHIGGFLGGILLTNLMIKK